MTKTISHIVLLALALFAVGYLAATVHAASPQGVTHQNSAVVCPKGGPDEVHCHAHVVTDSKGTPQAGGLPSGLGPAAFHGAYALPTTVSGNKVIAIVDAYNDPNIASDLAKYSSTYGLPQLPACTGAIASSPVPCFAKVNQNGQTMNYPSTSAGWSLEISLDVEVAHAMCQNCSILLVEASSNSFANLMAAEDRAVALGANVISNSYGGSEFSGETSYDSHFNHPGTAITVSSGDSGYGVEYPAASPNVTAVGGTTLHLSGTSYVSESAWSGAGSGCSAYEAQPAVQTALGLSGCSHRMVADVSADADPNTGAAVYDSVRYQGQSGWFQVGGTSLASPLVAATYALAGVPSGSVVNTLPYANTSSLHDIFTGANGSCAVGYLCNAVTGYDGPTGLGTPNGLGAF